MREMLRDKRVLYSSLFGPVFLVLLFVVLFGFLQATLKRPKSHPIHIVRSNPEPQIVSQLRKDGTLLIKDVPSLKEGERMVRIGEARVVLRFPEDFEKRLAANKPGIVEAVYDSDEPASQLALSIIEKFFDVRGTVVVATILASKGVPAELAEPLRVEKRSVKREAESIGGLLAGLLPYLIVIWAFYGGFSSASDMVAGEKERSTLETLLISPVSRTSIAIGKLSALTVLCVASSIASLVAVAIAGALPISLIREMFPEGVRFSLTSILVILGVLLPLSALFAGTLLAISAYARNTREAQGYLTMVSFVVLMPAIFSQFIGYTSFAKEWWVAAVPVLNASTVLKDAMIGNFAATPLLVATAVNVVLAVAATLIAVRMFGRERVLWRV